MDLNIEQVASLVEYSSTSRPALAVQTLESYLRKVESHKLLVYARECWHLAFPNKELIHNGILAELEQRLDLANTLKLPCNSLECSTKKALYRDRASTETERQSAIEGLSAALGKKLENHKGTLFWSTDRRVRASCVVSGAYSGDIKYKFTYSPLWDSFLGRASRSFFVLYSRDRRCRFALPYEWFQAVRPNLEVDIEHNRARIRVWICGDQDGTLMLDLPKVNQRINLHLFCTELAHIQRR